MCASGDCQSAQRKCRTCIQVGTIDGVNTDPDDPAFPAQVTYQLSLLRRSRAPGQQTITPFRGLLLQQRAPVVPSSQPSFLQAFSPLLEAGRKDSATQAGINFAVSGAVTTSYCALGSPVPKGYTQISATNGQPITTPSPKPTTTPASTPPPSSKPSSTSSCNLAWCGAPFCDPACGPS